MLIFSTPLKIKHLWQAKDGNFLAQASNMHSSIVIWWVDFWSVWALLQQNIQIKLIKLLLQMLLMKSKVNKSIRMYQLNIIDVRDCPNDVDRVKKTERLKGPLIFYDRQILKVKSA